MTRHINLLQPDMLPGHGRVQLPTFLVTLLLTLVACGLYAGYHWSVKQSLLDETGRWQTRVQDSAQRLREFREANPAMASEADLLARNQQLSERLSERENALSGLADQLGGGSRGFATPLKSLSEYDLEGIWLSRIELRDSQQHLGLRGFARQPGLVPRYLSQLEGSVFEGLNIQDLTIQQVPDDEALWQFSIDDRVGASLTNNREGR